MARAGEGAAHLAIPFAAGTVPSERSVSAAACDKGHPHHHAARDTRIRDPHFDDPANYKSRTEWQKALWKSGIDPDSKRYIKQLENSITDNWEVTFEGLWDEIEGMLDRGLPVTHDVVAEYIAESTRKQLRNLDRKEWEGAFNGLYVGAKEQSYKLTGFGEKKRRRRGQIVDTLEEQAVLSRLRDTALKKVTTVTSEETRALILERLSEPGAYAKNPIQLANEIVREERRKLEEQGGPRKELRERIKSLYDDQLWRIQRITRTESANAYTLSVLTGYKEQGIERVKWNSHTYEQGTCSICLAYDTNEFDIDALLSAGGRYPLSTASHPQCRCVGAGSEVMIRGRGWVPIGTARPGDFILDICHGWSKITRVTAFHKRHDHTAGVPVVRVLGVPLTEDHLVWTAGGWCEAGRLEADQLLVRGVRETLPEPQSIGFTFRKVESAELPRSLLKLEIEATSAREDAVVRLWPRVFDFSRSRGPCEQGSGFLSGMVLSDWGGQTAREQKEIQSTATGSTSVRSQVSSRNRLSCLRRTHAGDFCYAPSQTWNETRGVHALVPWSCASEIDRSQKVAGSYITVAGSASAGGDGGSSQTKVRGTPRASVARSSCAETEVEGSCFSGEDAGTPAEPGFPGRGHLYRERGAGRFNQDQHSIPKACSNSRSGRPFSMGEARYLGSIGLRRDRSRRLPLAQLSNVFPQPLPEGEGRRDHSDGRACRLDYAPDLGARYQSGSNGGDPTFVRASVEVDNDPPEIFCDIGTESHHFLVRVPGGGEPFGVHNCWFTPVIQHVTLSDFERMYEDEPELFAPGQTVFDREQLAIEDVIKEYQNIYGTQVRDLPVEHEEGVSDAFNAIRDTPYQQYQPSGLRFVRDVGATEEFQEAVPTPEPVLGQVTAFTTPENELLLSQFSSDSGRTVSGAILREWAGKIFDDREEVRDRTDSLFAREEVSPKDLSPGTIQTLLVTFDPWTMMRQQLVDDVETVALEKRLRDATDDALMDVLLDTGISEADVETIVHWRRDRPVWTLDGTYVPPEGLTGSEHNRFVNRTAELGSREMFVESAAAYVADPWNLRERDPEMYAFLLDDVFDGKEFKEE